jgi:hypothetical protein
VGASVGVALGDLGAAGDDHDHGKYHGREIGRDAAGAATGADGDDEVVDDLGEAG